MSARKTRRKSVTVSFSGDDDVVQHIIDGRDRKSEKRRQSFPTRKSSGVFHELVEEEEDEEEVSPAKKSVALEVGEEGVIGHDVFSFRTPKKSGQMAQKASESRTPKSILKIQNVKEDTPKRSVNFTPSKDRSTSEPGTPSSLRRSHRTTRKPEASTPYRLQKRHSTDSDSEDSLDSSESDSDDSDDQDSQQVSSTKQSTQGTPTQSSRSTPKQSSRNTPQRTSRNKVEPVDMPSMVEEYFDIHSGGVGPTSDSTLAKLDMPRMDQQSLGQVLSSVPSSHQGECRLMYEEYRDMFQHWMYQICNGFNILLYGLGSKRTLMEDFRTTMLKDLSHIVVNGYFPSLTVKHILNSITDDILDCGLSFKGVLEQCDYIRTQLTERDQDVFIILHSIDGTMLRNEKAQNILSMLSQIPHIHFIASVDHINSSLVWDQTKCSRFSWLWCDVTTFASYSEETSYENSLLVQQTGTLALSSLTHIMKSLTPNARGIFFLLVRYQLENKDNSLYIGLSLHDLYQRCREAFLVNSDLTLQAQLTEFRDHKLIRSKKSYDGVEHLYVQLDNGTLIEFLEQHSET